MDLVVILLIVTILSLLKSKTDTITEATPTDIEIETAFGSRVVSTTRVIGQNLSMRKERDAFVLILKQLGLY